MGQSLNGDLFEMSTVAGQNVEVVYKDLLYIEDDYDVAEYRYLGKNEKYEDTFLAIFKDNSEELILGRRTVEYSYIDKPDQNE